MKSPLDLCLVAYGTVAFPCGKSGFAIAWCTGFLYGKPFLLASVADGQASFLYRRPASALTWCLRIGVSSGYNAAR